MPGGVGMRKPRGFFLSQLKKEVMLQRNLEFKPPRNIALTLFGVLICSVWILLSTIYMFATDSQFKIAVSFLNVIAFGYLMIQIIIHAAREGDITLTDTTIIIPDNNTKKRKITIKFQDILRLELAITLKIIHTRGTVRIPGDYERQKEILYKLVEKTGINPTVISGVEEIF